MRTGEGEGRSRPVFEARTGWGSKPVVQRALSIKKQGCEIMKLLSSPAATLPTRLQEAFHTSTGQVTENSSANIYIP